MSQGDPVYAVMGASGHVGGRIAQCLVDAGKTVRVIARNAEPLQPLVKRGAKAVTGNADDTAALKQAFSGADAVFALIPPNYASPDYRGFQKKVVAALATSIRDAGVRYAVTLSSVGAQWPDKTGPIAGLYDMEQALNTMDGLNVVHLRPGYFMENFLFSIPTIKAMGVMATPMKADLPIAMTATRDIADAALALLQRLQFTGKSVRELLGQRDLTMSEAARILGKAIGKPDLAYVQAPYEDAEKAMVGAGMSKDIARLMIEMNRSFNEGHVTPTEKRTAKNTTTTSIETFAQDFARAFSGGGK